MCVSAANLGGVLVTFFAVAIGLSAWAMMGIFAMAAMDILIFKGDRIGVFLDSSTNAITLMMAYLLWPLTIRFVWIGGDTAD